VSVDSRTAAAAPTTRKSTLYSVAIVLSSLVFAFPVFVGRAAEAILDATNPANIDVTQPLAYLSEILGWSFGSLGVLLVVIIVLLAILYRRAKTLDAIALPLLLLALQIVLGVLSLLLMALTNQ